MMHYKGEDMDLRVPAARQTREGYPTGDFDPAYNNGRWRVASGSTTAGTEPLWVDEVVLACCNTAYDMAQAHGAADVGVEHLVHAMTRVEAAARIIEALGVREGQLRRESAALMAREVPSGLPSERLAPRRSPDVEDALRRASELAGRRGVAATAEDLLWALLHTSRDSPAIQMLRRLTPDWQRPDWGRGRETAASLHEAPRYVAMPAVEPRVALQPEPRYVHAELAPDRKALAELVRDVQRDIVASRGDAAALRSDLGQRLESLERGVNLRGGDGGRLADRMAQLEKAVHNGLGEGARNWAALGQRLQAFETALGTDARGQFDTGPLAERVADLGRGIGSIVERIGALERITEAGANERARRWTALSERLGVLETRLATGAEGLGDATGLSERVAGLERAVRAGFGEAARQSATVLDRVGDVEKYLAGLPADPAEGALIVDERLQGIERRFGQTLSEQAHFSSLIASRLESLEQLATGPAGSPDDVFVSEPLMDRISGLEVAANQRTGALQTTLAELSARLIGLEQSVKASTLQSEETIRARDREIGEMHDALIRLGENQHTLASAIADWRTENHDRFASMSGQIDRVVGAPEPMRTAPAGFPDSAPLPRVVMRPDDQAFDVRTDAAFSPRLDERVDGADPAPDVAVPVARGRGFWWWLFGTDDVSRSNRESELRWERMRQRIQEARERRREQT